MHFDFNIKAGQSVYVPSISNKPLRVKDIGGGLTVAVKDNLGRPRRSLSIVISNKGTLGCSDVQVAFPANIDWYKKLKEIYPDLEPCRLVRELDKNHLIICKVIQTGRLVIINNRLDDDFYDVEKNCYTYEELEFIR